jgi:hypothetical protein
MFRHWLTQTLQTVPKGERFCGIATVGHAIAFRLPLYVTACHLRTNLARRLPIKDLGVCDALEDVPLCMMAVPKHRETQT